MKTRSVHTPLAVASMALLLSACASVPQQEVSDNPLLKPFDGVYGIPPFDDIQDSDFAEALDIGIAQTKADVQVIADNPEPATFENTVEALDNAGALFSRVANVFYNFVGSKSNDIINQTVRDIQPKQTELATFVFTNPVLFERVRTVSKTAHLLTQEQRRLVEETLQSFESRGIGLNAVQQKRLSEINLRLGQLSQIYREAVLADTESFEMILSAEADLAGLPLSILDASAALADSRINDTSGSKDKYAGKHLFIPERSSMYPFLVYSTRGDLRKKLFAGYTDRGMSDEVHAAILEMIDLRQERAHLLGYEDHISLSLNNRVAPSKEAVSDLLLQVWNAAIKQFEVEKNALRKVARSEGDFSPIEGSDWWHYAEKVRQQDYSVSGSDIQQYLPVNNVVRGAFDLARRLYGVRLVERTDLPKYHDDVQTFEVYNDRNQLIGIYYADYYSRIGKRAGAWMSTFRDQHMEDGRRVNPIVVNVCNFPPPVGDQPSLLTLEQTLTFFHEFGHALHGLLSDVTYVGLSGTSVPRDFVEFPSQVLEYWVTHPDFMPTFAKHHATGEEIPADLVSRINRAENFNQGFATVEYTAAALLDWAWHDGDKGEVTDVTAFEDQVLASIGMPAGIPPRYKSGYFAHIFAGGYSAGYYSYIWSELFAADTFEYFKERGIFNKNISTRFRDGILSKGGSIDAMEAYIKFRGRAPTPDALMRARGF